MMDNIPAFMMQPLRIQEPYLTIERQPKKRGYRFRYSSEGQTHGGIPGESHKSDNNRKVYPTLKLVGHNGPAKVVVTLVTADDSHHLHAHSLIVNKVMTKGYHVFDMSGDSPLELKSIAIQHVVKDNLQDTLMDRSLQTKYVENFGWNSGLNIGGNREEIFDVSQYVKSLKDRNDDENEFYDRATAQAIDGLELEMLKKKAEELGKNMFMNQCRLCFQAFLPDHRGKYTKILNPVYSDIIYDGKTKQGAMLKIIRLSKVSCSVKGDEEVWLLADKLNPDDIEVYFFERESKLATSMVPWEDTGKFNKTDIYKQVCLIFKTPMYHDQHIRQPANVFIQLRRKTDTSCCSEPMEFKYTPIQYDRYGIGEKRKKEIPAHDWSCLSSPKKRYSAVATPPIGDLSQDELLVNADNYNAPFMMSNDPFANFTLGSVLKQEDTSDHVAADSELKQQALFSMLMSAQQLQSTELQQLLASGSSAENPVASSENHGEVMELPSLNNFSNAYPSQFSNSELNKYFGLPDGMNEKS